MSSWRMLATLAAHCNSSARGNWGSGCQLIIVTSLSALYGPLKLTWSFEVLIWLRWFFSGTPRSFWIAAKPRLLTFSSSSCFSTTAPVPRKASASARSHCRTFKGPGCFSSAEELEHPHLVASAWALTLSHSEQSWIQIGYTYTFYSIMLCHIVLYHLISCYIKEYHVFQSTPPLKHPIFSKCPNGAEHTDLAQDIPQ